MLRSFKPEFGIRIPGNIIKNRIAVEEAALMELKQFPNYFKDVIREYEIEKERPTVPVYPPKDKKAHALFLRFYRAAKRDLKTKRRITEKTLAMIK